MRSWPAATVRVRYEFTRVRRPTRTARLRPTDGQDQPTGADLITDRELIRRAFPYLSPDTCAVVHARRCGWFSGQQLGMLQLEEARAAGVEFIEGRVEWIETAGGKVSSVQIGTRR